MMKRLLLLFAWLVAMQANATPIDELLERIDKGASKKFKIELKKSDRDFFELDQQGTRPLVRGNTWVNIASGINWYLKYYAGVHLSWNQMQAELPAVLPAVTKKERHDTDLTLRYAFNYCTFSYSMAFWDWQRWEREIDWLALHGVNLPLAIVGEECVWRNMLLKLGYSEEEIGQFIAGPVIEMIEDAVIIDPVVLVIFDTN
jgi:alpha-N-acetylglucosaminidase